ncbi:MAG: universal stress protein [Ginsengibacter sp.]
MKKILVPVDFSDASNNASYYAASLANIYRCEMILIHAYINPAGIDEMPSGFVFQPGKELWDIKKDIMHEYVEALRKKYTIRIRGVVREGTATPAILDFAKDENADLIVMGMKGKGESNSLFGSNTTSVMGKSSVPVLILPENVQFRNIEVITLATNFEAETNYSDYSLLRNIAQKNEAFIQILNVRKMDSELSGSEITGKINTASAFEDLNCGFYTIKDDEVDDGIEDFLEDHPSDLLVMIGRKRNLFQRIFGISHTKKMSYETEIPLLIL